MIDIQIGDDIGEDVASVADVANDNGPELDYADEAAILDTFKAPDFGEIEGDEAAVIYGANDNEGEDIEGGGSGAGAGAEPMGKDSFWIVFQSAFQLPAVIVPHMGGLAITEEETPSARAASDAVHSLLEIYYPKALMPMGDTFALILTAAPFLWLKVMVVKTALQTAKIEAANKRREAMRAGSVEHGQPANDNEAPPAEQAAPEFKSSRSPMSWMDAEQAA